MDRPDKHAFSPYQGPDRRRFQRHTVQVPIEVQLEGSKTTLAAETSDLSRNGCYLRLPNPLPVGLWVQATLWLDSTPIQIAGRVVTRHPNFGNGIMFLKIDDHDMQTLTAYIETVFAESTI
jgi:hypothetical protein